MITRASIRNRSSVNDSILFPTDNNEANLIKKYYEAKLNE